MYQLTGVSKIYQKGRRIVPAVRDLDLTIGDGEWLAVQGRTGHGKTTLLQMLGGLDRPTSGIIEFDGQDLAQLRESQVTKVRANSIGFIFQTFNLIPTLSAAENVEAALIPLGTGLADRRALIAAALDSVGLADRASHLPSELSGGQQQRVAIARALVKEPKVLLADEPTGNLDEDTRDEIIQLLENLGLAERARHLPSELSGGQQQRVAIARALVKEPKVLLADEPTGNLDEGTRDDIMGLLEQLWRDTGLTLVLVTHDSSVARRAQRIGIMQHGKLSIRQDTRGATA